MKRNFLAVFLFLYQFTYSQTNELIYLDLNEIMISLKANGEKSQYFSNLDFEAMVFLFPENFNFLKSLNPHSVDLEKFDDLLPIKELDINLTDIKSVFTDRELLKGIINEVSLELAYEIEPIYLKSPYKAVFKLKARKDEEYYWGQSFGLLLEKNKLKIYHIFSFIE